MTREEDLKKEMQASIDYLKEEVKQLRTGRANPAILDNVVVDVYGTKMKIKGLANVTTPEARQILVTPFDRNNLQAICKAIEAANLNLSAVVESACIRINVPSMDEAVRKEMVKKCKEKGEGAKVRIRDIRRKYNDLIKKLKDSKEMPEDQMKKEEKRIQEMTDKFCKDIDQITQEKEKEILSV